MSGGERGRENEREIYSIDQFREWIRQRETERTGETERERER